MYMHMLVCVQKYDYKQVCIQKNTHLVCVQQNTKSTEVCVCIELFLRIHICDLQRQSGVFTVYMHMLVCIRKNMHLVFAQQGAKSTVRWV